MALKEEKVPLTSGKKKASIRRETSAVSGMKPKIVRKNQNTLLPHLQRQSYHEGRSVSRKRSIRGKGNHGSILRQPCRYCLRGTCTRTTSCEYWHPPECQSYKTETGCKAGDKCQFPPHKVDEQPKKGKERLLFTHKERKATTKMQWLL